MSILWDEARGIPDALQVTLDRREGFDQAVESLSGAHVRRIVATGNGASYYAAMAIWLASLNAGGPDVVALPAGVVAGPDFQWREGDVLLAISSSGGFRDVVLAAQSGPRTVAITANRESALGRAAASSALAQLPAQRSATHTQGYCVNVVIALALWSELSADAALRTALDRLPETTARALDAAPAWADEQARRLPDPRAAVVFGSGPAWAAALEAALLLKEVARIPAEGTETREGATSGMFALAPGQLAMGVTCGDDPLLDEAERICASAGATVARVPGGELGDPRTVSIASFPAALALSIALAEQAGVDVDAPEWAGTYERTAR
jgi:fructoselysine-6-P-deglycase FrlB-like protein